MAEQVSCEFSPRPALVGIHQILPESGHGILPFASQTTHFLAYYGGYDCKLYREKHLMPHKVCGHHIGHRVTPTHAASLLEGHGQYN